MSYSKNSTRMAGYACFVIPQLPCRPAVGLNRTGKFKASERSRSRLYEPVPPKARISTLTLYATQYLDVTWRQFFNDFRLRIILSSNRPYETQIFKPGIAIIYLLEYVIQQYTSPFLHWSLWSPLPTLYLSKSTTWLHELPSTSLQTKDFERNSSPSQQNWLPAYRWRNVQWSSESFSAQGSMVQISRVKRNVNVSNFGRRSATARSTQGGGKHFH